MQLTEAELAFRIHKSGLQIHPIWHQKQKRVQGHILVCFLAYVLWKALAPWIIGAAWATHRERFWKSLPKSRAAMWFCRPDGPMAASERFICAV